MHRTKRCSVDTTLSYIIDRLIVLTYSLIQLVSRHGSQDMPSAVRLLCTAMSMPMPTPNKVLQSCVGPARSAYVVPDTVLGTCLGIRATADSSPSLSHSGATKSTPQRARFRHPSMRRIPRRASTRDMVRFEEYIINQSMSLASLNTGATLSQTPSCPPWQIPRASLWPLLPHLPFLTPQSLKEFMNSAMWLRGSPEQKRANGTMPTPI